LDDTITTIYYLCEELLKAIGHRDDPQEVRLSIAEVMTIPLVACAFFSGNLEASRSFLDEYGYIPKAISKSRFNRRLHAIDSCLWRTLFDLLAEVSKHERSEQTYVVDSLPVALCDKSSESAALKALSSRRTRRSLPWLHRQQTPLLLRVAGAPGGKRQGRASGVLTGGCFGS